MFSSTYSGITSKHTSSPTHFDLLERWFDGRKGYDGGGSIGIIPSITMASGLELEMHIDVLL